MSNKKQRLRAQKEKQDREKKELEEYENKQRELSKNTHSKSVEKMKKKASGKHLLFGEPVYYFILKLIMIIPFAYSGFFYGGVLVAGVFGKAIEDNPPVWVGWLTLAGIFLMGAGIIIAFLKKYIISFGFNAVGTILFMKPVQFMIHRIQNYLNKRAVETSLQNLDKVYMKRYYPILGIVVISFVLLVISLIRKKIRANKLQYEKDTAPVKSIVE